MIVKAPNLIAGATAPAGIEVAAGFTGAVVESDNLVSGFTENYKGWSTNSAATRFPIAREIVQDAFPDAAANTTGAILEFSPRKQSFEYFYAISVEFDFSGAPAGTLTAEVEAFFIDGGSNMVSVTSATDQTLDFTVGQLATLHRDNQKIIKMEFKVKSSLAGRQLDKGRLNYLGVEG